MSVYLIIQGFGRQTIKYLIVCGVFIVLRLLSGGQGITIPVSYTHLDVYKRQVLDRMRENTTYVRNIKKYLLAALYNAPATIDSYYTSLVSHDMYGSGERR